MAADGSNSLPAFSGVSTSTLTEGTAASYLKTGQLKIVDADVGDLLTTSIAGQSVTYTSAAGVAQTSLLSPSQIAALQQGLTLQVGDLGSNKGVVNWSYSTADTALDFLASGETLSIVTTVQVDDHHGGLVSKDVAVTIKGANDAPQLAAGTPSGVAVAIAENPGTTGNSALVLSQQGTLSFSDADLTDLHTVSVAAKSGGYVGTLKPVLLNDTAGGQQGQVGWTYSVGDNALDFLAAGQQAVQTYTVSVSDGKGGVVKQDIVVTLTGTNDIPTVSGTTAATIIEQQNSGYTKIGGLSFADVDLADRLSVSVANSKLSYFDSTGTDRTSLLSTAQSQLLLAGFSLSGSELNSNKGALNWTYGATDASLDFLGAGDVVTVTETIKVDDNKGGVTTKDVVISLRGANDAPVVVSSPSNVTTVADTEFSGKTGSTAVHLDQGQFSFSDVDLLDTHTISAVAKGTNYIGKFVPVLSTDSTGGGVGTVKWTYTAADGALDSLAAGQQVTQTYTVSVRDSKGAIVQQDINVILTGAEDSPTVSGVATASIYEPLNATLPTGLLQRAGTLVIADADKTDGLVITSETHVHLFDVNGQDLSTLDPATLTAQQTSDLALAQSLASNLVLTPTTSGNNGQVSWSYSVDKAELAFLTSGETVTVESLVHVQDVDTSGNPTGPAVTQPISVKLVGSTPDLNVKDFVPAIVAGNFLAASAGQISIGCQTPTTQLKNYHGLATSDGVAFNGMSLTVTKDGASFDGIDFRGCAVKVSASNVSFTNCLFDATSLYYGIRQDPASSNMVVDHCTFDGLKADSSYTDFILSYGTNNTISNNIFLNAPNDGIYIQSGTVSGNYMAGGGYHTLAHADGIWVGATNGPVVIENNVIDWRASPDAAAATNNAIRVNSEIGTNNDGVTIQNNVILGGNYTIDISNLPTWTHTADQLHGISHVHVVDNIVDLGRTGALTPDHSFVDFLYAGNQPINGTGGSFQGISHSPSPLPGTNNLIAGTDLPSTIYGTTAADYIVGGASSDIIYAGNANGVVIQGGGGRDYITAGTGADTFLYKSTTDGADLIFGFKPGVDKIDIADMIGVPAGAQWKWVGTTAFTGTPMQIRYFQTANNTSLLFDINGDMLPDFKVDFVGKLTLYQTDLIVTRDAASGSVLGSLWSNAGVSMASGSGSFAIQLASDQVVVKYGEVFLQDSDGSLLPLNGLKQYTFSDGTVQQNDGNSLVDDLYYYATNRSVWAAHSDAEADYYNGGWQAGRDPNGFFSTSGYLAAYGNSVPAGSDPLTQFDTVGWKAGYDPSANFDTQLYLLHNPDVAASGVDPLSHYLSTGQAQNRATYAAVGPTISSGFDAEYYLLANPGVAASGLAPETHYRTIGWQQGLNPNAYFNTNYYLHRYPDATASGMDPLQSYMTTGWLQGRDPSATFSTSAYLAANPDVAASGVNPLQEFLTAGIYEGRSAVAVGSQFTDLAPTAAADGLLVGGIPNALINVGASTGVLANDSDADGGHLSVMAVQGSMGNVAQIVHGSYGDLKLSADGSYSYTVKNLAGATGNHLSDSFNYVVTDGQGGNNSAQLTLTLDRAPTALDVSKAVSPAGTLTVAAAAGLLQGATDADGDTVALSSISGGGVTALTDATHPASVAGTYGTLSVNADGSYIYIQTAAVDVSTIGHAVDTFTYTVTDGFGGTATQNLNLTLDRAPVAGSDSVSVTGQSLVVASAQGVLSNDSDPDGDSLIVAAVNGNGASIGQAVHGSYGDLILAADGSYSYVVTPGLLSRGQTGSDTFNYTVSDNTGMSSNSTLVFNVVSANANPTISGSASGSLIQNSQPAYTVSGALVVGDPDAGDRLNGSLQGQTVKITSATGVDITSTFTPQQLAVILKGFSLTTTGPLSTGGSLPWNYKIDDASIRALAKDEVITIANTVVVQDQAGGQATQNVIITVTGTNQSPSFQSTSSTGAVSETVNVTGSAAISMQSGSLAFNDVDGSDSHSVTYTMAKAGYIGTFVPVLTTDSIGQGTGVITWQYTASEKALDSLAVGQQVVQVYTVQVADGKGGVARQNVTISLTGANDLPTITGTTSASWYEYSAPSYSKSGTILFADPDSTDRLSTSVMSQTVSYKTALGADLSSSLTAGQIAAFKQAFLLSTGDLGSNKGQAVWTYNVSDSALHFIGQNDVLTLTTTVQVDDHNGGLSSKDITIIIKGADDAPIMTLPGGANLLSSVTETAGSYGSTENHTVAGTISFSDADISDTHTVKIAANGSNYIGTLAATIAQDTTGGNPGTIAWNFQLVDKALDYLSAGQVLTQSYTVSLADGKGGIDKEVVSINLLGAADTFSFDTVPVKPATISTFTSGSDLLVLKSASFGGLSTGLLTDDFFVTGSAATTNHAQFVFNPTSHLLMWDADGTGSGNAVAIANIAGFSQLHASDILLI